MKPTTRPTTRKTRKKYQPARSFYLLPLTLFLIIAALVVLPFFFADSARVLSDPAILRIIYLLLALSVVLVTFGLLGDSHALIGSENKFGLQWQLGGSVAGVAILFLLLTKGLSPYSSLTVHLLDSSGNFLGPADGPVEITVASEAKRSVTTENGEAIFAYLPRAENWRLFLDGGLWRVDGIQPDHCADSTLVLRKSWGCRIVALTLVEESPCLTDLSAVIGEASTVKASLRTLLENFRDDMQSYAPNFAVRLTYSEAVLSAGIHELPLSLHRASHELKACGILADLGERFSLAYPRRPIKIYANCTGVLITRANEDPPAEDYELCA